MFWILAAGLGAIVGSFLNALLYRWGTGRSVLRGRSRCMHCGETLTAPDLIPVLSWVLLRGRCRSCRTRISWRYPLVELLGAGIGVAVYAAHQEPFAFAFWFVVWMTLLFVAVYDLRHQVIPWSASLLVAALALGYVLGAGATPQSLMAGPVLALPILALWWFSRGRAMGLGDAPLQLGLGWLLGLEAGLTALLFACWAGAIVGIFLLMLSKRYTIQSEVPFAPFLVGGAAAVHFLHVTIFSLLQPLF